VRFVTLSSDPARDSPEVHEGLRPSRIQRKPGIALVFPDHALRAGFYCRSSKGFGQDIRYSVDKSTAGPVRELSHVLKGFPDRPVREHPRR